MALIILLFTNFFLVTAILMEFVVFKQALEGGLSSIIILFLLTCSFGYSLTKIASRRPIDLEFFFMNIGIGLASLPLLFVVLNTLHVPLDYRILLLLALPLPFIALIRRLKRKPKFSNLNVDLGHYKKWIGEQAALFFTLVLLIVYLQGSFRYPWLEDGDPWQHAVGAKYVALEKTYSLPVDVYVSHYLEPYPPSYDVLLGIVHQLNNSTNWTLKFFNSLLISLGLILFFFMVRSLSGNDFVSVVACFFLLVLPSYMNHFIWAQSLALIIFYPTFYALEKMRENWKWSIPSAIMVASNMLVQPLANVIFGAFYLLYLLVYLILDKSFAKKLFFVGIIGLLLSMLYWAPTINKYGWDLNKINAVGEKFSQLNFKITHQDRTYHLDDFLYAKPAGGIDQHVGVGLVLFPLFLISVLINIVYYYSKSSSLVESIKKNSFLVVVFLWLIFTFIGLEGNELPVSVMPYKFWPYFSIPLAIISANGVYILISYLKRYQVILWSLLITLLFGILLTSGYPKYVVETALWPAGTDWQSQNHLEGYLLLGRLPKNSMVYPACYPIHRSEEYDQILIGLDLASQPWDREVLEFRKNFTNKSVDETYLFLKKKGYKYVFLDGFCMGNLLRYEENQAYAESFNGKLEEVVNTEKEYFDRKIFGPQDSFLILEIM
ncbi:hypothetical protein ACFLRC_02930 [Candidatus Altiarchaeota archaeon]